MKQLLSKAWRYRQNGWRQAAVLNTVGISIFTLLTIALLAWSSAKLGTINGNVILFRGNCATTKKANIWLHLLLNVFSTGILASSNFFMQVLSSPSRSEVDSAHRKSISLEVGVPSIRNLFFISNFKKICSFLFFLSSIPVHLFFNSAIFTTDYQGSKWQLTIASEGFANGAQYFPPGALLLPAGAATGVTGYGQPVSLTDYLDHDSEVIEKISSTAKESRGWKRIEVPECRSQYQFCSARTKYGDVVMVVESHNSSFMFSRDKRLGWTRDGIFEPPSRNAAQFWDPRAYGQIDRGYDVLPADRINPHYSFNFLLDEFVEASLQSKRPIVKSQNALKFDLKYCLVQEIDPVCKVGLSTKVLLIVVVCLITKTCLCIVVLATSPPEDPLVVPGDAIVSFITAPEEKTAARCTLDRFVADRTSSSMTSRPIQPQQEPPPQPQQWRRRNRRWLSAIPISAWVRSYFIFTGVIIFLVAMFVTANNTYPVKGGQQAFSHSPHNGLLNTEGSSGLLLLPAIILANAPQLLLSFSYFVYNALYTRLCVEKEWNSLSQKYHPIRVTRPRGQQISTYRLQLPYRYSIPLIVISVLLHWLVSNTLYVFILEGGYFLVEQKSYQYFNPVQPDPVPRVSGFSDDSYVGIGFSTISILVVLLIACFLATIPFILCSKRMKGPMVLGGSNSMVISAACHLSLVSATGSMSPLAGSEREDGYEQVPLREWPQATSPKTKFFTQKISQLETFEVQSLLESAQPPSGEEQRQGELDCKDDIGASEKVALIQMAQSRLRWGVVKMPESFYQQFSDMGEDVGHLAFGIKEQNVEEPVDGHWYA
uniref:DUF6536 domain-containing protein n=1 Tax=Coccidioides posadasii RMSCC 3488 TaxID=454284 RepID=A0A0J6FMM2_COCPO|nr:hypothetical protein CPAG_07931 [Coccidioides posadasii RMSCC 3488]